MIPETVSNAPTACIASRIRRGAWALAACLAAAGPAAALSVTPNPAPAEKPFTLTLQGLGMNCYTLYTRDSAVVDGNRIDLRYTASRIAVPADPASGAVPDVCPVSAAEVAPAAYAPVFSMPALKPGTYEVWATEVPECRYSQPACMLAEQSVSVGGLLAQIDFPSGYTLSPASASAGQAFDLQLLSYGFDCGTVYERTSVRVDNGTLILSFMDRGQTGVVCPAVVKPYGPTFRIPALPAGDYPVKVNRLQLDAVADAGTLRIVADSARKGWYLKEHAVAAGKPQTMQLLRNDIGNCQTSFSNTKTEITHAGILASFVMETRPDAVCITDIRPFGPTFELPALAPGVYPVIPEPLAACQVLPNPCVLDRAVPVAPADTLVVMQALAVRMSELRARAPGAVLRGDDLVFALPEPETAGRSPRSGSGAAVSWRAALLAPDGRVLEETVLGGSAGAEVTFTLRHAPAGFGLLRLIAPDGALRFIPIER
jgi:hypothetical protein